MLRPATPLSILFFVAFVLLLLSTLSTPIIKAVPLATFEGVNFGVFGYCDGDKCSGLRLGYGTGTCGLFTDKMDCLVVVANICIIFQFAATEMPDS